MLVEVDGKPAATLNAGQYFIIPAGTIHNATNKSNGGAKVLATYIIEKGNRSRRRSNSRRPSVECHSRQPLAADAVARH